MKAALALFLGILMLAGSLFPQTDVEEVYKIPGLFSHYQYHKQTAGPDFDFWQFMVMHYSPQSAHAKTPHKGVQLPSYNHLAICYAFVLSKPTLLPAALSLMLVSAKRQFAYLITYCFQHAPCLLQPPCLH